MKVQPDAAFYSADLREFVLPYDVVREADIPDQASIDFRQSTYVAAANLGKWDRLRSECAACRSRRFRAIRTNFNDPALVAVRRYLNCQMMAVRRVTSGPSSRAVPMPRFNVSALDSK